MRLKVYFLSKSFRFALIASLWAILTVTAISCEQSVRFEQPQPQGIPDLGSLPKRLEGVYFSDHDSSTLEINDRHVIIYNRALIKISIFEIGEGLKLSGDTLIDPVAGFQEVGKRMGDSLQIHWPLWIDTLFAYDDRFILRKYKSRYFLNTRLADGNYQVYLIDPQPGGYLRIEELLAPEDIDLLDQVTPVRKLETDSVLGPQYEINPDRKALRKLMRRGFTVRGLYRRIPGRQLFSETIRQ